MIYLITFAVAALFLWLAGKCRGALSVILTVLGLAAPCLLAGMRDETVGTDILSYAKWQCLSAQSLGPVAFLRAQSGISALGWNVFTWIAVRLTGGLSGYLFCIEAMCIIPIYMGLRRAHKGSEWLGVLVWLLGGYAFTLNGMRQAVAMSIVFYAMNYIFEHKPWKFIIGVLIATFFHQTAIVALLLYPLARALEPDSRFHSRNDRWSPWKLWMLIIGALAASLALGQRFVMMLSVFKESYSYQVNRLGETDFSIGALYALLCVGLAWFSARGDFDFTVVRRDESRQATALATDFASVCLLASVGALFWQLNLVAPTLGRLGYYGVIALPYLTGIYKDNGRNTAERNLVLLLCALVYFIVMTLMLGKNGVWPYTSQILGVGWNA